MSRKTKIEKELIDYIEQLKDVMFFDKTEEQKNNDNLYTLMVLSKRRPLFYAEKILEEEQDRLNSKVIEKLKDYVRKIKQEEKKSQFFNKVIGQYLDLMDSATDFLIEAFGWSKAYALDYCSTHTIGQLLRLLEKYGKEHMALEQPKIFSMIKYIKEKIGKLLDEELKNI